jgi:Holliday junction DNA helicase RuvA
MITSVSGTVVRVGVDQAVIEVGGVGLALLCTPAALSGLRSGAIGRLATSLVVREDSLTLYGFADDSERDTFELLQTASGVGPKLARAVLAVLDPDELSAAISTGDLAALTKVPGVGRKGAERLVLELRDRVRPRSGTASAAGVASKGEPLWREQVRGGLAGLGWTGKEVESVLDNIASDGAGSNGAASPDVAVALRQAIRMLGRR